MMFPSCSPPSDQRECKGAGIIRICRDVEKILAGPERAEKDTCSLPLHEKINKDPERNSTLHECTAPNPDRLAEHAKEEMTEFVKGQAHVIEGEESVLIGKGLDTEYH